MNFGVQLKDSSLGDFLFNTFNEIEGVINRTIILLAAESLRMEHCYLFLLKCKFSSKLVDIAGMKRSILSIDTLSL